MNQEQYIIYNLDSKSKKKLEKEGEDQMDQVNCVILNVGT